MINIDLAETYGLGSFEEAVEAIETLRRRGFSDDEINGILERCKEGNWIRKRDTALGVIIKGVKMPENCVACPCSHFKGSYKKDNYCQALVIGSSVAAHLIDYVDGRPSFCPLIPWEGGGESGA